MTSLRIDCADGRERERAVVAAVAAVRRGAVVLIPTESVYAVAVDAFSARGVQAVRDLKRLQAWAPLPVMVGSRSTVPGIASRISAEASALMDAFWPGPLTLLLSPQPTLAWELPTDAPLAVRMPLHPVALAVLVAAGPLVVTAANVPGMTAPTSVDQALAVLDDDVQVALDAGDLADDAGLPSSVVDTTRSRPDLVREGAVTITDLQRICPDVTAGATATGA